MDRIDFRSDTVTWPTANMRQKMASAPVGDDVYGEDPTVNKLESMAAELMGKQAGLFVSGGSMGNLVSILTHTTRGDEIIAGNDSHVVLWEAGSISTLGGVAVWPLATDEQGQMNIREVQMAVRADDIHLPRSRMIHVENSYGAKNGFPLPPSYFEQLKEVADRNSLAVHLDGARLFNAAIAQGVPVTDIVQHVDSVTFCLSKGLCAPVGSIVCGSEAFISEARRWRKAVGGGMRQAGILAAAGIVALEDMIDRLAEDHEKASLLASGLARIPGLRVDVDRIRTNIVFFDLEEDVPFSTEEIRAALKARANIWVGRHGPRGFRAVTHFWIDEDDVARLVTELEQIIAIERTAA